MTWKEAQRIGEKLIKDFVDTDCDSRLIMEATYSIFPVIIQCLEQFQSQSIYQMRDFSL